VRRSVTAQLHHRSEYQSLFRVNVRKALLAARPEPQRFGHQPERRSIVGRECSETGNAVAPETLTRREREIATLAGSGYSSKLISE
jgi:DNA-binding NarL/FixJ family response regulator